MGVPCLPLLCLVREATIVGSCDGLCRALDVPSATRNAFTTNCLFVVGLMARAPFHINDITRETRGWTCILAKCHLLTPLTSHEKKSVPRKVFGTLSAIFSKSEPPLAIRSSQLVTWLAVEDSTEAGYELFKVIMVFTDLTDQYWVAARLAIHGAFQRNDAVHY